MSNEQREKMEKTKINSQIKHVPKDAQVIMSIMKELNVPEYEPRVVNQLLEFTYRYVTCILDDAKVYANHARKKVIDLEDVKLATDIVLDKSFTGPPPRHVLAKLAEVRNAMPLPPIKPHCGLRLPPDRYCLTACNFKLRANNPPRKMIKSALDGRSALKTPQLKAITGVNAGNTLLKRQTVVAPKTQVVTIPKPVIKFTAVPKPVSLDTKIEIGATSIADDNGIIKMEVDDTTGNAVAGIAIGGKGMKREREEEEFEMI